MRLPYHCAYYIRTLKHARSYDLHCSLCAEISTRSTHGLRFLTEDGTCKLCLPPQYCWHPWLEIEPATLSSVGQRATSGATEATLLTGKNL